MSPVGTLVFVTGYVFTTGRGADYATVAYDATSGAIVWQRGYDGGALGDDFAQAVAVSPNGSMVFVTGGSWGSVAGEDYATLAYDAATGAPVWGSRFNGSGNSVDEAQSIAVSPDGTKVYLTGRSGGAVTGADFVTIAYDAATGANIWKKRYNGVARDDWGYALALSPDGSKIFVTGHTGGLSTADYQTVGYDAITGARLWVKTYNGPGNAAGDPGGIAVSADSSAVFVTGDSEGTGSRDYATLAYDAAAGVRLWLRRYNLALQDSDVAQSVASSPDGSKVFVTGFSVSSGGGGDYLTLAYDPITGATLWVKRLSSPGNDFDAAYLVSVSPDSSTVFVTGSSAFDYGTVAYEAATGAKLWTSTHVGTGGLVDKPYSMAVAPDGTTVFITGDSYNAAIGTSDWATVGYET